MISLAIGYRQSITDAPAVATVITADQIQRLGALTLAQVLETVPGLHVSSARGVSDIYVIRGFYKTFSTQVLVLVNGIPVNDIVYGGRPLAWTMPVHDIARIEIVRGPASALYGADAFAGVINVITKTSNEIKNPEVGAYAGSFQTYGSWLLGSGHWHDVEMALYLEGGKTHGYRRTIKQDDQTRIDRLLGTSASLAPGPINTMRDDFNMRLDISQGDQWRFRAGYQAFLNVGTGVGTALTLDPKGDFSVRLFTADLTYSLIKNSSWVVDTQFSYQNTTTNANLVLYPPGAFGGFFPEGVQEKFSFHVNQQRAGLTALYEGIANHRVRLDVGLNHAENGNIEESRNFILGSAGIPQPTGRLTDIDTFIPWGSRSAATALKPG